VSCQEVGHTFGLAPRTRTSITRISERALDYTNDPSTNQHPNKQTMRASVDLHTLDSFTTIQSRQQQRTPMICRLR